MRFRTLITLLVFAVLGYVVWRHLGDLQTLERTLRQGRPLWILAAFVLQGLALLNVAALYHALYRLLRLPITFKRMLSLSLAAEFVNFTTVGGAAGAGVLLKDAAARGLDSSRVVLANVLFTLFNLVWFSLLLVAGLVVLFVRRELALYELASAAVLLGGTLLLLGGVVLAGAKPGWLERIARFAARLVNGVGGLTVKRPLLEPNDLTSWTGELSSAAAALRRERARLLPSLLFTLFSDGLSIVVLYAWLRALLPAGAPLGLGVLVAGYGIGVLFTAVAVTPQGVGVVEGAMGATLVSLGLPVAEVTLGVLSYRGLSFWLPLLVGGLAVRFALEDDAPPKEKAQERESLS